MRDCPDGTLSRTRAARRLGGIARRRVAARWIVLATAGALTLTASRAGPPVPVGDGAAGHETLVRELLRRMTLDEKIGQMMQLSAETYVEWKAETPGQFVLHEDKLAQLVRRYHVGSLLNGEAIRPERWVAYARRVQEICLAESRLKIPIIYGIDHMHGASYVSGATIFPHALNMGATFDVDLVREMGHIAGLESADLGHHWIFAPLGDVAVNPMWPRTYETFGEDPYLSSVMAATVTRAIQENPDTFPYRQAACAKHFLGYSSPQFGGWDRTQAAIPGQMLQEIFVPPFRACIDAGVKTVMLNSAEINGVPVHASRAIVTDLLRGQLGFQGVVVTDWEDIIRLVTVHHVAADEHEATRMAIEAGIDMSMVPLQTSFFDHLKGLVAEGKVSESRIDQSVARILRLKADLGLFEHPFPRADRLDRIRRPENVERAYEAACDSIVVLKNDGILPLARPRSIVVAGPCATVRRALCGGWTMLWFARDDSRFPEDMPTLLTALQSEFGADRVRLAADDALPAVAKDADAIVIAAGEMPYAETPGNIVDFALDPAQLDLIRTAQRTGKPVILVMVAGRPRTITPVYERCAAVLWAGLPGFEGARAIAAVLGGKVNPSGKLNFTYPALPGVAVPYHHKFSTEANGLVAEATLAPFGAGLSYTRFEYGTIELSAPVLSGDGRLSARVTVTNTGKLAGKESVLWFLTQEVGSIARPVKLLKHFEKRLIRPGESVAFSFQIEPQRDLAYPDESGRRVLEAGFYTVAAGDKTARFRYAGPSTPAGAGLSR